MGLCLRRHCWSEGEQVFLRGAEEVVVAAWAAEVGSGWEGGGAEGGGDFSDLAAGARERLRRQ